MSWDIFITASKIPPPKVAAMPENWDWVPLGGCKEVRTKLSAVAHDIDWSDPAWGRLERNAFSIEFSLGEDEPCKSLALHVRGHDVEGELSSLLRRFVDEQGWYAIDASEHGEFWHQGGGPEDTLAEFNETAAAMNEAARLRDRPFWKRWFGLQ